MGLFSRRPKGAYSGRLAFDPDTEFHTDPEGNPVVTDDGGKTWRYATKTDTSHNARYKAKYVVVEATKPGDEEAQPHHVQVQPADAHYHEVLSDPDPVAEKVTSHTEAWVD